ncbi:MAG: type II toxin-antitoxin system RelE/ParE family toxin [Oscillospiraceae bacterium]|nr:type II toxin-antitoxin system RelE/ParE family toxin [Oscillospiraceae bacterium]
MWKIEYYKTANGNVPVKRFIDGLDDTMRTRAALDIERLQKWGNQLHPPHSKYMRDGIFELRIQVASNISRVFYFFFDGKKIILTNGFIKKTQRTPTREIEKKR